MKKYIGIMATLLMVFNFAFLGVCGTAQAANNSRAWDVGEKIQLTRAMPVVEGAIEYKDKQLQKKAPPVVEVRREKKHIQHQQKAQRVFDIIDNEND